MFKIVWTGNNVGRFLRYIGCLTAYGVFFWRYLNVPQNWEYVGSFWSLAIIAATMLPETVYPFLFIWASNLEEPDKKEKTG